MSHKEMGQTEVFEKLKRREIRQKVAAGMLGLSVRQIKRKLRQYRLEGSKSLVHKGRGKVSNRKINQDILEAAIDEVRVKYKGFAPTQAHEKLVEEHGFKFSLSLLRNQMVKEGLWNIVDPINWTSGRDSHKRSGIV